MHQHPQFGQPKPWSVDLYRKRLYGLMHPDRAGFFEKRSGNSAVRAI